jgi:hypothetical protein
VVFVETLVPFKADSGNIEVIIRASPPGGKDAAFARAEISFRVHVATNGSLDIVYKQPQMRTSTGQHNFGLGIIKIDPDAPFPMVPDVFADTVSIPNMMRSGSHSIGQSVHHQPTQGNEWHRWKLSGTQLLGGTTSINIAPRYSRGGSITIRMEAYASDADPLHQHNESEHKRPSAITSS